MRSIRTKFVVTVIAILVVAYTTLGLMAVSTLRQEIMNQWKDNYAQIAEAYALSFSTNQFDNNDDLQYFLDDINITHDYNYMSYLKETDGGNVIAVAHTNYIMAGMEVTDPASISAVKKGEPYAGYSIYTTTETLTLDVISPVYDPDDSEKVIGALSIGFPVDEDTLNSVLWGTIIKTVVTMVCALILSVGVVLILTRVIVKSLITLKVSINEIATGNADLTQRLKVTSKDEMADVTKGFNNFLNKLQQIVNKIKESKLNLSNVKETLSSRIDDNTESINEILSNIDEVGTQMEEQTTVVSQTSSAVAEIAENINSLERMIENQSVEVNQANSAVEEMIRNIDSVNGTVEKMTNSFVELKQSAVEGMENQQSVIDKISEIERQSSSLLDANVAIANVAQQTNLLAMNAAIEAAHAGEAGKGFSVVADEIRKLSETSSVQSKRIKTELTNIKETISNVVEASKISSASFNQVDEKIQSTDVFVNQIRTAMTEQTEGSKLILDSLGKMTDSTTEVRGASKEMQEGNKLILGEIQNLQNATGIIRDSVARMSSNAKNIEGTSHELAELSEQVNSSVNEIGEEIDLFKS